MQYELLTNDLASKMRERFINAFLKEKWNTNFRSVLYSARFDGSISRLDFYQALGELTKRDGELYFLSDLSHGWRCELQNDFVAKTIDAKGFAKQIFDEWCREFYVGNYIYSDTFHQTTNNLFKDKLFLNLLPLDIYIFDGTFNWMLAFTHENCEDESEQDDDIGCVEPRRCCYLIKPIKFEILPDTKATEIRSQFERTFIQTPEEYEIAWSKWAEEYANLNPDSTKQTMPDYATAIYWDKLKAHTDITFDDAISFLQSIKNPVYFLSNPPIGKNMMNQFSNAPIGFVATTDDPKRFADYIYDEWKMCYTLPDDVWINPELPGDLFVFDNTFNWMLYFTHHNVDDYAEEETEGGWNRLCIKI